MSGKDNINPEKMFVVSRNTRTRGHKFKIEKQRFRTNLRQYFFQIILSISGIVCRPMWLSLL